MNGYVLTTSGIVLDQWIDKNGHMNVTSYMAVFDQGTDNLFQKCGLEHSDIGTDTTIVAGRILIDHRKELFAGEEWELWSGIVTVKPTYLTVTHRLRSASSIHATCDIRARPFSKQKRIAVMLNPELVNALTALRVPGLVDRFKTGG